MFRVPRIIAVCGLLSLAGASASVAAPITGFEAEYNAVFTNCTLPVGGVSVEADVLEEQIRVAVLACEAAINAYSGALVGVVELEEANESFTALRIEVFGTNQPSTPFQEAIDALFELLLPDSGAIAAEASPTVPG